jgi:hypothetical protein
MTWRNIVFVESSDIAGGGGVMFEAGQRTDDFLLKKRVITLFC